MTAGGDSKVVDTKEMKEKPNPLLGGQLEKEDLAPDGGWGWVVVVGMIIVNYVTICQGSTFALIYSDFLNASGNGGQALTAMNLMIMISFSISGPISNALLKRWKINHVGVLGGMIYGVSNIVTCFVPDIYFMMVLCLAQGIGIGIMLTVSNVSFNSYFVKLRTKVMGATQVAVALGSVIYPLLAEYFLRNYGFRGCVALLGAISFNGVVSLYVMEPVERHYKYPVTTKNELSEKEDQDMSNENHPKNLLFDGETIDRTKSHSATDLAKGWQKNRSVQSLRTAAEHEKPLLIESLKTFNRSQDRNGSGIDIETGSPRLRPGKGSNLDLLANKLSIMATTSTGSINGMAGVSQIPEIVVEHESAGKKKSMLSILGDFFEVSLLRDGIFLNISIGSSITFLTDLLFMGFLPMTMTSQGYSKTDIALAITVSAVTELAGKIIFMLYAMFFQTKSRHVFLTSVYCLIFCRIATFYCDTLTSWFVVIGLSGLVRSWFLVTQVLVIADHFKIEQFPAAWALFSVINGCNALIICPLIGYVKDLTQSYVITQYLLLGGLMLCAIPWTIEILIYDVFAGKKTEKKVDRK